jgi:uncharacterized membrane protein
MSVTQPPADTPFGLDANVAAGLAYLFGLLGGIIIAVGGGTNKFVRWAAAQSITMWALWIIIWKGLGLLAATIIFAPLVVLAVFVLPFLGLILWLWTFITAFQGKEVQVPLVAGLTRAVFKTYLQ